VDNSQPFFDFGPIWDSRWLLLEGFGIAMFSAVAGIFFAIVLGLIVALMRLSRFKVLRGIAFVYTQLFRGVPLYVLILWIYFGLVYAVGIDIPRIPSGIIALALLNSGYLSETFRSGILAIDKGQREAGEALGLRKWEVTRYIVLGKPIRRCNQGLCHLEHHRSPGVDEDRARASEPLLSSI
jgi:His/Glu/Gln/Arg/opine family amino acid ABC transporter permease subunit